MSAKKMQASSFADAIRLSMQETAANPPKKSWFSKLPPGAKEDFLDLKRRYRAGEYQGVDLAVIFRGVAARCKEAKWPIPKSVDTVTRWLRTP